MERKMPEHRMSFGNRVRKLFGRKPKDESITGENSDGRITTTKIKYNDDFSIHNMTITSMNTSGDTSTKTEYRDDDSSTETIKEDDGSYTSTTYEDDRVSEVQHFDKDMKPVTVANENGDSMINGYVVQGEIGYDLAKRFLSATEEEKEKIISDSKDFSLECPEHEATGTYNINGEDICFNDGERYTGVRCTYSTRKRAYYHVYIDGIDTGVGFGDGRYVREEGELGNIKYEQQISLLKKTKKAIESGDKETLATLREEARNYKNEWQKFKANYKMGAVRENIASTKETTTAEAPAPEQEKTTQEVSRTALAQEALTKKAYE